jgi:hypothetical protein
MPELKNLFIKGKMNKDLDERLVPQGEYRDALNVSVSYSESSDVGALQNILGNTERAGGLTFPSGATCIGTVRDTENDKIYWFGTSATADYIAELDPSDNSVDVILCEAKTTKLTATSNAHTEGSLVVEMATSGGIIAGQYVSGDNIVPGTKVNTINNTTLVLTQAPLAQIQNGATLSFSNVLNFSTSNLITGVAVLDGVLYFTDDLNEPRQVDIEYWRGVTATDFTTSTNLSADRISLYKKGPLNAPIFNTLSASIRGGVGTSGNKTEIVTTTIPNLSTTNVNGSISIVFSIAPNYNVDDIIILERNILVGDITESSSARLKITSETNSTTFVCTLLAKTDNVENAANIAYVPLLEEEEPLFELKFPRFAYRYKYTNGQYSTFSPFSLPAFIPGDFEYDAKKAYNLGMENSVRRVVLTGWIIVPVASNYQTDIEEIDILYKDSVSSNIYIVDSIKKESGSFAATFEVKDKQIFKAVQANQLLRPFDSIPRKAKALEITGNRLIFGNYLHNFNYTDTPTFTVNAVPRTTPQELIQKLSLKTKRTYQIGIAFQDEYGRQTPVFTDKSGVLKLTQDNSEFNLQFEVSTVTDYPAEATHYKYYIKETSNEYYNICINNIYDDEEGFLYLSIPSAETNKVSVDDFIVLKKENGNVAYKGAEKKFKVLDKFNEPPDFLSNKNNVVYSATIFKFDAEFYENQTAEYKTPGLTPVEGHNTITIQDAFQIDDPDQSGIVTNTFKLTMVPGSTVRFRRRGTATTSNKYTIATVQPTVVSGGNAGMEMTFEEPFGADVEALYSSNKEAAYIAPDEIYLEKLEDKNDAGNPEYAGKFFIKLNNSIELKNALEATFDESLLKTISSHSVFTKPFSGASRGYFIWDAAPGGTYASGNILQNVPAQNGVTIPDGFHVIISTQEFYNDSASFYSTDPWNKGLVVGNYVRFSGGNQRRNDGTDDFDALYETNTTTTQASTNSKNIVVSSASGIEIGDKVTANAPFEQISVVRVEAIQGNTITLSSPQTISSGANVRFIKSLESHPNYKIKEVIFIPGTGAQGYWALKFETPLEVTLPILDSSTNNERYIAVEVRTFDPTKIGYFSNPPIFEVEPEEGVLDIYYETEKTYSIGDLNTPETARTIPWANCISFGNGVESDRIRDDFNAPTIGKGVRVSTVFEDNYKEERVKSGLIFSGLYNSKNGINRLNQFIIAENITEEANPIYGGIQKLNTRDTDLTLLCDDKILKVPARKDLLFQADGNPQVTSTDRFLGTIIPYAGNYGCQHPESFADHIYRAYFVDRTRGKVLRLGGDGITEISNYGMKDYFKDKLVAETGYMFGSYDENKDKYNISLPVENTVVSFSEGVNGWPTRLSFHEMESGISLNNMYYTFKDGKIFSHDNETRNTFYGTKTDSEVTFYLNGNPGNAKNFRTLNYQGDSGWVATNISTDKQAGNVSSFVEKEGIYYNYISGKAQATKTSLDLKALNVQGLGTPTSISVNDATFAELPSLLQPGDKVFNNSNNDIRTVQSISGNTITLDAAPTNAFSYFAKDNRFNTSGILGYYAEITITNTSTSPKEIYSVGSEVSLSS